MLNYASEAHAYETFIEEFSDGLPVVLPTPERVAAMLASVSRDPAAEVGVVMPSGRTATVRDVAVNAVMAGAPPATLPILLAAVEAVLEPGFNLNGIQSTTHSAGVMIVVSGPYAAQAGMNASNNALGQGNRANATIGRALRLVMTNVGGGIPGKTDMSVQGGPQKYGFCFAERLDGSPWPSLAARQGAPDGATTVTVLAAEGPHVVADHRSPEAEMLLDNIADVMRTVGSMNACIPTYMGLAVAPQHARLLAKGGYDVPRTAAYLFEKARNSLARLRRAGEFDERRTLPIVARYGSVDDPQTQVPVLVTPEHLIIAVAGGDSGGFSAVVPSWSSSIAQYRVIEGAQGQT
jgi:hypothetical protein